MLGMFFKCGRIVGLLEEMNKLKLLNPVTVNEDVLTFKYSLLPRIRKSETIQVKIEEPNLTSAETIHSLNDSLSPPYFIESSSQTTFMGKLESLPTTDPSVTSLRLPVCWEHEEYDERIDTIKMLSVDVLVKQSLIQPIHKQYDLVSHRAVQIFLHQVGLLRCFKTLRHYFFRPDNICKIILDHFCQKSANIGQIVRTVNQYITLSEVHLVATKPTLIYDCTFNTLEGFELHPSKLNWPLTLIINEQSLQQYNKITRTTYH
eukprot:TRINITY_DN10528_c0_g1_i1.p1 TRINITY_DN10528_c0_g1~~TRINITY_DN10528_c0_g1_i1.p1  ORF type:complete len:261 (-),score=19.44 TRINITY_DN10528_c0_g1_i1:106-888(-)